MIPNEIFIEKTLWKKVKTKKIDWYNITVNYSYSFMLCIILELIIIIILGMIIMHDYGGQNDWYGNINLIRNFAMCFWSIICFGRVPGLVSTFTSCSQSFMQ